MDMKNYRNHKITSSHIRGQLYRAQYMLIIFGVTVFYTFFFFNFRLIFRENHYIQFVCYFVSILVEHNKLIEIIVASNAFIWNFLNNRKVMLFLFDDDFPKNKRVYFLDHKWQYTFDYTTYRPFLLLNILN